MDTPSKANYSKKQGEGKEFTVNSWADPGYIPKPIRRKVIARDGDKCVFCGKGPVNSLCHIRPKCRGGRTTVNNLTVCCLKCRRQKAKQLPLEFLFSYYFVFDVLKEPLDKADAFDDITVKVRLYWRDGAIEDGEVPDLPDVRHTGFYFTYPGDDQQVFVSVAAIKKIVPIRREKSGQKR